MHMDTLTAETLQELLAHSEYPCVSIYMPTRPDSPFGTEHRARFKTLLRQAKQEAQQATHNDEAVLDAIFAPALELVDNVDFWRNQGLGLAYLASPTYQGAWRLPVSFEELALCGPRFHIKPLLPLFSEDGHFYVLALSRNQVRLLRASRHQAEQVPLPDVPGSLEESMRFDDQEKQLQFHTGDSKPQGDRPAAFHGQGVGQDDMEPRVEEFLRAVDNGVGKALGDDSAPLVLAGVEEIFGLYSRITKRKNLVQQPVRGNPDELSDDDLRRQAWEMVEPVFNRSRDEAVERYHNRKGTGLASSMLEEVIPAAAHGRVATLFVPLGNRLWGMFDAATGTATLHNEKKPESRDLLDLAATQTISQGGRVYAMDPAQLPDGKEIAAVFRY